MEGQSQTDRPEPDSPPQGSLGPGAYLLQSQFPSLPKIRWSFGTVAMGPLVGLYEATHRHTVSCHLSPHPPSFLLMDPVLSRQQSDHQILTSQPSPAPQAGTAAGKCLANEMDVVDWPASALFTGCTLLAPPFPSPPFCEILSHTDVPLGTWWGKAAPPHCLGSKYSVSCS